MTVEAPRSVVCGQCGDRFELSPRNTREHEKLGAQPVCRSCRIPRKPVDAETMEKMRRWWLERYSLEELHEIAAAIWPNGWIF